MTPPADPNGHYVGEQPPDAPARLWYVAGAAPPEPVAHIARHSPDGIAWGYQGSGPSDCALAILAHATGDNDVPDALVRQYAADVIARLPVDQTFIVPGADVHRWLTDQRVLSPAEDQALAMSRDHHPSMATELDGHAADPAGLQVWADDLARRETALHQREQRLEARAAAIRHAIDIEPAWTAPAAPIATQIRYLLEGTGEPIEVVAKGLDVEPSWARDVLDGTIADVDLAHIQRLCESLHASPYDLWGTDTARTILHAYGPELWPRFIEPLGPPDTAPGLHEPPAPLR